MDKESDHRWIGGTLASFLALVQFRAIAFILQTDYGRSVDAAWGVVTGHPHWRIFQSRVLGPYIVLGLSNFLPSFLVAHVIYSILTLAVAGYLAFRLGRVYGGDLRSALLALALFEITFAFLLSRPWLYAWDYMEIIAFFVFFDFVLAERGWKWFVALYLVTIFAHDYGQFIALWMILDPLCRWGLGRAGMVRPVRLDRAKLLAGIVLVPVGMAILEILRRMLLIQEMGPLIFADVQNKAKDNLFFGISLFDNLRNVMGAFVSANPTMPFVVPLFLVLAVGLAVRLAWRFPIQLLAFALVYCGMAMAGVVFAVLYETRTLVDFIPLIVGATVILSSPLESGWVASHRSPTLGEMWRFRGKPSSARLLGQPQTPRPLATLRGNR